MLCLLFDNGLPVYAMRERVNRYTVIFVFMLTSFFFYGTMGTVRKGKFWELRISGSDGKGGWIKESGGRCRPGAAAGINARLGEGKE